MSTLECIASHLGSASCFRGLGNALPSSFDPDLHSYTIASLTNLSSNPFALFGTTRTTGGAGSRAGIAAGAGAAAGLESTGETHLPWATTEDEAEAPNTDVCAVTSIPRWMNGR